MRQCHRVGDSDCAGCGRERRLENVRLRQISTLSVVRKPTGRARIGHLTRHRGAPRRDWPSRGPADKANQSHRHCQRPLRCDRRQSLRSHESAGSRRAESVPDPRGPFTCRFTDGAPLQIHARQDATSDRSLRLDQPATDRVARQLDAVTHPKLVEDVLTMAVDSLDADEESRGDVFRCLRLGDQL